MEESDEVVVLYEYTAQLPDELNLKVGDVVTKVERMEGGWWRGDLAGKRGMFPDNFVKVGSELRIMFSIDSGYPHIQTLSTFPLHKILEFPSKTLFRS